VIERQSGCTTCPTFSSTLIAASMALMRASVAASSPMGEAEAGQRSGWTADGAFAWAPNTRHKAAMETAIRKTGRWDISTFPCFRVPP
jgi:hypothetical protein